MSSRQEEKQKRRAEREALEASEAKSKARRERLQLGMGALVAIAAVIIAVVVFAGSGGDGDGGGETTPTGDLANVAIPPVQETDLRTAARTAGCVLTDPANEGRDHVSNEVTYKNSNPPASGPHNVTPAEDGNYEPGNSPAKENFVHSLEHGRIQVQYKPGTDPQTVQRLTKVMSEPMDFGREFYKTQVFENNTAMEPQVAAVAWTHVMSCPRLTEGVFDAVRAFRQEYTDKGPEFIP